MSWHVGDLWNDKLQVDDPEADALVDSTPTVTITKPDLTTFNAAVTHVETGIYQFAVNLTEAGQWKASAVTTGAYQAARPKTINVLAG